jgi:hypothetical protein
MKILHKNNNAENTSLKHKKDIGSSHSLILRRETNACLLPMILKIIDDLPQNGDQATHHYPRNKHYINAYLACQLLDIYGISEIGKEYADYAALLCSERLEIEFEITPSEGGLCFPVLWNNFVYIKPSKLKELRRWEQIVPQVAHYMEEIYDDAQFYHLEDLSVAIRSIIESAERFNQMTRTW